MSKAIAEQSNSLSIFWLKKNGYLEGGWRSGGIKWTYGVSGNESNISFFVFLHGEASDCIKLKYTHTDRWSEKKSEMFFEVLFTSTSCNYSGKRYWFICPLTKNGQYCGRRVGMLFSIGKWFGCRHCGDICYAAQLEGGGFRVGSVTEPVVEKAYNEIKRFHYNGKPTRRYKRYLRLRDKMDYSWARAAMKFGIKF